MIDLKWIHKTMADRLTSVLAVDDGAYEHGRKHPWREEIYVSTRRKSRKLPGIEGLEEELFAVYFITCLYWGVSCELIM